MNIPTTGLPAFWAVVAALIGVIGALAALRAWIVIQQERKKIVAAKGALIGNEAWLGAHGSSEIELNQWLARRGIKSESFISDIVHACWAAWLGGRAASLTELHTLVARRERSKLPAKLSSGVAALLLIIGIVGTLSSVKPILKAFQFKVSSDGELQGAAESTELINGLLSSLGDAFWPSLVALSFTVLVVFIRGIYLMSLHQFSLDLDRFAIGTILPQYRLHSISEEYREVKKILGDLAESILNREKNFSKVVGDLKVLSEGLHPVILALENTTKASAEASETLSSRSRSIADGLTKTLGGSSPIYKAVKGFEGIFERTTAMLDRLSGQIENLGIANDKERNDLAQFVACIKEETRAIIDDVADERKRSGETAAAITSSMNDGLQALHSGLTKFEEQQKRSWTESKDELRTMATNALASTLMEAMTKVDELTQAGAAIPVTLEKLERAVAVNSKLEDEAIRLISAQAERSSASIDASVARLETLFRQQRQTTGVPIPLPRKEADYSDIPGGEGFSQLRISHEGGAQSLPNAVQLSGEVPKPFAPRSTSNIILPVLSRESAANEVEYTPTVPDNRAAKAGTVQEKKGNWLTGIFKR